MRRMLDIFYRASGVLAGICLVAICVVVLLQVGANAIDFVAEWVLGAPFGLVVPSYADFAGFLLAAASFLALAWTLTRGEHIRVGLLLERLGRGPRLALELWCTAIGAGLSGFFAWYATALVVESFRFGDMSRGIVAIPLWIPQSAMALGLIVLTVAFIDAFVSVLRGRDPYAAGDRSQSSGEG
jgi:TRAP-type C4-dicarboxylate transport system permease small subunit